ncbi:MAG: segregation/condensation protein A [Candidatus Omnitrophota bacterium]
MSYKIALEIFEGPLDLLLYLIKKEEIDIYDIPIAEITRQYLAYLEFMKMLDLNIAGEFIVMAATLMHIKSKMLLPEEKIEQGEEEIDPRAELMEKLIEYKKFKEAAKKLEEFEIRRKNIFIRSADIEQFKCEDDETVYFEASLFDLLTAFSKVLKEIPKDIIQEVIKDEFTVEQKIEYLVNLLEEREVVKIDELFSNSKNKLEIVAIFLAVLELMRLKEIVVVQKSLFDSIEIRRNKSGLKLKTIGV